jgi:hypothetical protein
VFTTFATIWLFALQTADPVPADWKDFSPKAAGFRVRLPGVPKEKSQKIEATQGITQVTLWGIEREGIAFMVIRSELPPDAVAGGAKMTLDEARERGVQKSGGTLREEREIVLDGHPGREMVLDLPDSQVRGGGIYRARIYLVGRTHYQVLAMAPKARERSEEINAFLNSFRLEVDKPASQGDRGTKNP